MEVTVSEHCNTKVHFPYNLPGFFYIAQIDSCANTILAYYCLFTHAGKVITAFYYSAYKYTDRKMLERSLS